MQCTRCDKETQGKVVALVFVNRDVGDGRRGAAFTGVVWCEECVPHGTDQDVIRSEMMRAQSQR